MQKLTSRRDVLRSAAAAAAGLCAANSAWAIDPVPRSRESKLKLSCAAYSFRDQLTGKKEPHWTLDQFIDFCASQNLDGTELTSYYFPNPVTPGYLAELKRSTFLAGLEISGTAIRNDFCLPPGPERDKELAHVRKWIEYAAMMGAPAIRIFSGGVRKGGTEQEARQWCLECIEESCRYAGEHGVFLGLENHGGISATADGLLAIVREVRSPWFGVNLDSGNFRSPDPYGDLAKLAPYAITVQVKTEITPQGSAKQPADLPRIITILRQARYRGYVTLEYEAAEDANLAVPRHLNQLRSLIS